MLEKFDWPADKPFEFKDEPGEHDPCYVVMPDGAMIPLAHHALNGVDQARAQFIVDACNDKLTGAGLMAAAEAVMKWVDDLYPATEPGSQPVPVFQKLRAAIAAARVVP